MRFRKGRSRVEPLLVPAPALRLPALIKQPVVQTESAVLPEFDSLRGENEARPVRGRGIPPATKVSPDLSNAIFHQAPPPRGAHLREAPARTGGRPGRQG